MSSRLRNSAGVLTTLLLALIVGGCKSEQRGGPRVTTVPVTGVVLVDGQPAAALSVQCHPVTPNPQFPMIPSGRTDTNGKFTIGTYESGDGAPAGDYQLTFVWDEINLINGRYSGDKLNKKYADPKSSEVKLTVADSDKAIDLGEIKLATK